MEIRIRPIAPKSVRGTAAAFGGAPHQSEKVLFGTFSDSFSPRGEALYLIDSVRVYVAAVQFSPKASPLREKLSKIGSSEPIFD